MAVKKSREAAKKQERPRIPELSVEPNNFGLVRRIIERNYPAAWNSAKDEIMKQRNRLGIRGIVGRVEANLKRASNVLDQEPLYNSTHNQIDTDIKRTNEFLIGWGQKHDKAALAKSVADYWDQRLESEAGPLQDEGLAVNYERARAKTLRDIWHDIQVMEAQRQAVGLRKKLVETDRMEGLPDTR